MESVQIALHKLRAVFNTLFLVVATTALVTFTLKETRLRILRFTLQLR